MIASWSLHYEPAILHCRELVRSLEKLAGLSELEQPAAVKLWQALESPQSLQSILQQKLFGCLSVANGPAETLWPDAESTPGKSRIYSLKRKPRRSSVSPGAIRNEVDSRKPWSNGIAGNLFRSSSEATSTGYHSAEPNQEESAAVACIELLWEKWLNRSTSMGQELRNAVSGQDGKLRYRFLPQQHDYKDTLSAGAAVPASKANSGYSSSRLAHELNRLFKQLLQGRYQAASGMTQDSSESAIVTQEPSYAVDTLSSVNVSSMDASQSFGKDSHISSLHPALFNSLVDRAWRKTAAGEHPAEDKPGKPSKPADEEGTESTKEKTSAQVGGYFQAELEQLVDSLGLKPLNAADPFKEESQKSNTGAQQHQSNAASTMDIDENDLIDIVNQMLLAQARHNGVNIP